MPKPKVSEWQKSFQDLFMYDRGTHLEFDALKAGGVAVLIEFIQQLLAQARKEAVGAFWNELKISSYGSAITFHEALALQEEEAKELISKLNSAE